MNKVVLRGVGIYVLLFSFVYFIVPVLYKDYIKLYICSDTIYETTAYTPDIPIPIHTCGC